MLRNAGDYTTLRLPHPAVKLAVPLGMSGTGVTRRQAKMSRCVAGLDEVTRRSACSGMEGIREGVVGTDSAGRVAVVLQLGVDSLAVLQTPAAGAQARVRAGRAAGMTVRATVDGPACIRF